MHSVNASQRFLDRMNFYLEEPVGYISTYTLNPHKSDTQLRSFTNVVDSINLDDGGSLRCAIYRLETKSLSTRVPPYQKIPSDRVLAFAMKQNPANPHTRSNPKEKGHVSITVSKIPSDRVMF